MYYNTCIGKAARKLLLEEAARSRHGARPLYQETSRRSREIPLRLSLSQMRAGSSRRAAGPTSLPTSQDLASYLAPCRAPGLLSRPIPRPIPRPVPRRVPRPYCCYDGATHGNHHDPRYVFLERASSMHHIHRVLPRTTRRLVVAPRLPTSRRPTSRRPTPRWAQAGTASRPSARSLHGLGATPSRPRREAVASRNRHSAALRLRPAGADRAGSLEKVL